MENHIIKGILVLFLIITLLSLAGTYKNDKVLLEKETTENETTTKEYEIHQNTEWAMLTVTFAILAFFLGILNKVLE